MKYLLSITAVLLFTAALSFGQVQQVQQTTVNITPNGGLVQCYAVSFYWQGDAITGAVPITPAGSSSAMQGWRVVAVEFRPGTPAPTGGYSVQLLDSAGVDLLQSAALSLSASASQLFAGSAIAPPLYGTFSLSLTGNSVASARGAVFVYLSPVPTAFSVGGGGGGGGAVSSVFGRTGAVVAQSGDYSFSQISGTVSNSQLANSSVTYNGQAVALGASGNVNAGAAAHSVALNEGNGSAIAGASIGTAGRLLIDQGAAADPSFNAMSGDCTITSSGAITCTKVNGATPQVTYNGVTVSLGNSGTIGCAGGGVNAQTANYTLAAADNGGLVTMNGSNLTATLPNPPASAKWCATILNLNSTALTVSRNTLQINGGTTNVTLLQYQAATFFTDNSNYFAGVPIAAGSNISLTPSSNQMQIANTAPAPGCINTGTACTTPFGPTFQFTDPTIPSFSWFSQPAGATATNSGPNTTLAEPTGNGNAWALRSITAPATPYTITVAFFMTWPFGSSGGANVEGGLFIGDAGTSRFEACEVSTASTASPLFRDWTAPGTFSSNVAAGAASWSSQIAPALMYWLRMTDNGTNISCQQSADGVNFVTIASHSRTSWTATPNRVGFGINNNSAGDTLYMMLVSWKQS